VTYVFAIMNTLGRSVRENNIHSPFSPNLESYLPYLPAHLPISMFYSPSTVPHRTFQSQYPNTFMIDHFPVYIHAARDWFSSFYRPVTEKIKKLKIRQYFPKATIGDMYVYLCYQARLRSQKRLEHTCSLPEALEEIGILTKATKIILLDEGFKKRTIRAFRSLFRLGK